MCLQLLQASCLVFKSWMSKAAKLFSDDATGITDYAETFEWWQEVRGEWRCPSLIELVVLFYPPEKSDAEKQANPGAATPPTLTDTFVATYVAAQLSQNATSCDLERLFGVVGREVDGRTSLTDAHINDQGVFARTGKVQR